jgi:hypothetical protein
MPLGATLPIKELDEAVVIQSYLAQHLPLTLAIAVSLLVQRRASRVESAPALIPTLRNLTVYYV